MRFHHISLCLDMHGCPNRCRHCWLGHTPNGNMPMTALRDAAAAFRPFAGSIEVFDWYREPDYADNYREMWELTAALSDRKTPHFELASVWRLVRDPAYAPWLGSLGVKTVQLTLFGGEELTDRYTGWRGAYREILRSADILLEHGIVPRIQMFLNRETLRDLPHMEELIRTQSMEERCRAAGGEFGFFLHTGSCDRANAAQYGIWITPEDLQKIPASLAQYTCCHFGKDRIEDVFGRTEAQWYAGLAEDASTESIVEEAPVFYIDHRYDVYPNVTTPAPWWNLGNLYTDGAEKILERYASDGTPAQKIRRNVPLGQIVRAYGDPDSRRLFGRDDCIGYLWNRYAEDVWNAKREV